MEEKIRKMIDELTHQLEHAEEERSKAIQNGRIQLEAQLANLDGRLSQKIEDMKAEIERARELLPEG